MILGALFGAGLPTLNWRRRCELSNPSFPFFIGSSFVMCKPTPLNSPGVKPNPFKILSASFVMISLELVATPKVTLLLYVSHFPWPRCFGGSSGASGERLITFMVNCEPLNPSFAMFHTHVHILLYTCAATWSCVRPDIWSQPLLCPHFDSQMSLLFLPHVSPARQA